MKAPKDKPSAVSSPTAQLLKDELAAVAHWKYEEREAFKAGLLRGLGVATQRLKEIRK